MHSNTLEAVEALCADMCSLEYSPCNDWRFVPFKSKAVKYIETLLASFHAASI